MNKRMSTMMKHSAILMLLAGVAQVQAHEGHGLSGLSHWHASDALMLLSGVAAAALGLWLVRRK